MVSGQALAADGEKTYKTVCFACHGTGVAGAPKLGDKANWGPRIAQGNETLYTHAIKGFTGKKGMMPAKGGNPSIADADVKAAVDYMVKASK
jgi:cytochrome c5